MKLFVGNCTKQHNMFQFRLEGNGKVFAREIKAGTQESFNLEKEEIDQVIGHHKTYGLIDAKDVDRTKSFSGLAYSIDKPFTQEFLERGIEQRDDAIAENAQEARKTSAASIDQSMEQLADERGVGYKGTSVEIEQTPKPGEKKGIDQKIDVEKEGRDGGSRRK